MDKAGLGQAPLSQWFMGLSITGIVLLLLVYGRPFLVPIVVGFLIFTVLSAGIDRVSRIRMGRVSPPYWLAAIVGLVVLGAIMVLIYSIVSGELMMMIAEWPTMLERFQGVVASLSEWLGQDLAEPLQLALADFDIVNGLRGLVTPAGVAIASIVVVLLYVGFMFVESGHFPQKIDRLFTDPARAAEVRETGRRIIAGVHRYLLLKTLLSAGNTLAAYAVLKIIGVDFAETWAMLTFFLNFIPKIGSITGTVLPSLFALLQFQEFQPVFLTVVGLGLVHGITGEVVEPMVMGKTLNLSSLVIMAALTFWAMVWGVAGAFLAVPLMAVILTICSKIPALRPVAIMLSSDGDIDVDAPSRAAAATAPKPARRARKA